MNSTRQSVFILGICLAIGVNATLYANTLLVGAGQSYTTVQSAINAASADDTIKVLPGTYNEGIIINKDVVIAIHDVLGRDVRTLVNEDKSAGSYRLTFDAAALPSGVYLYRLAAGASPLLRRLF